MTDDLTQIALVYGAGLVCGALLVSGAVLVAVGTLVQPVRDAIAEMRAAASLMAMEPEPDDPIAQFEGE